MVDASPLLLHRKVANTSSSSHQKLDYHSVELMLFTEFVPYAGEKTWKENYRACSPQLPRAIQKTAPQWTVKRSLPMAALAAMGTGHQGCDRHHASRVLSKASWIGRCKGVT